MSEHRWLECHAKLLRGEYDGGWPQHEWIRTGNPAHQRRYVSTPTFDVAVWRGETEPITLLINADFGMGDTIQFWRFVPLARARVAHVILRCDEDFRTLFENADVEVVGKDEPLPLFDKIIHMMALPAVLGVKKKDISGRQYLIPNYTEPTSLDWWAFENSFSFGRYSKIGICWRGNPFNPRDHLRSIPQMVYDHFRDWFPERMTFFSLNKLECPEGFLDLRGRMRDWNQTARVLQFLDLVISVDTAVAHLAGALGRPVWTLVPTEDPDWRWGTEGDKTLWYDSMTLFRNEKGWGEVIDRVARTLIELPANEW